MGQQHLAEATAGPRRAARQPALPHPEPPGPRLGASGVVEAGEALAAAAAEFGQHLAARPVQVQQAALPEARHEDLGQSLPNKARSRASA